MTQPPLERSSNWLCLDCGKDTFENNDDYYMLRNRLWRQLVPREQRSGNLLCHHRLHFSQAAQGDYGRGPCYGFILGSNTPTLEVDRDGFTSHRLRLDVYALMPDPAGSADAFPSAIVVRGFDSLAAARRGRDRPTWRVASSADWRTSPRIRR